MTRARSHQRPSKGLNREGARARPRPANARRQKRYRPGHRLSQPLYPAQSPVRALANTRAGPNVPRAIAWSRLSTRPAMRPGRAAWTCRPRAAPPIEPRRRRASKRQRVTTPPTPRPRKRQRIRAYCSGSYSCAAAPIASAAVQPRPSTRGDANTPAQTIGIACPDRTRRREFEAAKTTDDLPSRWREFDRHCARGDGDARRSPIDAQRLRRGPGVRDDRPAARPRDGAPWARLEARRATSRAIDGAHDDANPTGDRLAPSQRHACEQRSGRPVHTIACMPGREHGRRDHGGRCRQRDDDE